MYVDGLEPGSLTCSTTTLTMHSAWKLPFSECVFLAYCASCERVHARTILNTAQLLSSAVVGNTHAASVSLLIDATRLTVNVTYTCISM